ncbi:unnamed protein product [marine sediment metagenome]|uniref:Uncharacterized protein n=1 Tax=marine sediment metagenome TaxID=412755 RepID=X1D2Q3_9ZZZZ
MSTYQQALKEVKAENEEKLIFLKKHKNLFPIADEYAKKFSLNNKTEYGERGSRVNFCADAGTIRAVGLFINLGKNSIVSDVLPIVDEMIKDPRLEMIKTLDKEIKDKYEPIDCTFKERNSNNEATIQVRIFIYYSTRCKEVGTGKFKEIMKIECE